MKKVIVLLMTVCILFSLTGCYGMGFVPQEEAEPSAYPSPLIDPVPSPKSTPVAQASRTPETTAKPTQKTGVISPDIKDLIHTDYDDAIEQVSDRNVVFTEYDNKGIVQVITLTGDCNYTIDGVGCGIPYGHTAMRLAEQYGDSVWGDDSYAAFEIPDLKATIGIFTDDGETVSRVELRSAIYY